MRYFIIAFIIALTACHHEPGPNPKNGFITVADSKLYYETTGTGESIVLLHGGYMDRRMWDDQVREFSKQYHVITCDLRGQGATIDGDSDYFMYEAIRMLLDTLHI